MTDSPQQNITTIGEITDEHGRVFHQESDQTGMQASNQGIHGKETEGGRPWETESEIRKLSEIEFKTKAREKAKAMFVYQMQQRNRVNQQGNFE